MRERPSVKLTEQLPSIIQRLIIAITKTEQPHRHQRQLHRPAMLLLAIQPATLQISATAKVAAAIASGLAVAERVLATAAAEAGAERLVDC